ncbi:uncharacterized protein FIBRA_01818 [Fibroporia radiculosa]|uniref:Uncharacterized protein n=1 Tax=Fibroporia radiculosa TaxID=599839 RepID=J4I8Q0_9APHY|nr:uncharacterized protein FIBRA_01818 [Fibroporia radiculosa]CCL99796.1 predicted protein [Fibroporia radiculosa]
MARELYKNTTMEQLAFFQLLKRRESHLEEGRQMSEAVLKSLWDTLGELRSSAEDIDAIRNKIVDMMSVHIDKSMHTVNDGIMDIFKRGETFQVVMFSKINSAVETAIQTQTMSLQTLIPSLAEIMSARLNHVLDDVAERQRSISDIADIAHTRLMSIGRELGIAQQASQAAMPSIVQLESTVSRASVQLEKQTEQAEVAHFLQLEAARSAAELAETLADLTSLTQLEMQNITHTAATFQEQLRAPSPGDLEYYWSSWWKPSVFYLFQVVLQVDPTYLDAFVQLRIVRILVLFVRIIWWIMHSSVSLIMSIAIILISIERRVRGMYNSPKQGTRRSFQDHPDPVHLQGPGQPDFLWMAILPLHPSLNLADTDIGRRGSPIGYAIRPKIQTRGSER